MRETILARLRLPGRYLFFPFLLMHIGFSLRMHITACYKELLRLRLLLLGDQAIDREFQRMRYARECAIADLCVDPRDGIV